MAKILIVDDDPKVTTLLKRFLSTAGYEVTAINHSSKAVQTANSIRPDLFILDIMMPQPDGFKLCTLLRAIPDFAKTPILIITSLDLSNSKASAFGADDYLAKPFDLDDLASRIDSMLTKTRKIQ
ncbi:MAG: response regulator transcription factor [Chloroflexi bacterium]|nr:response regulator transcription factor [Chloroflexota bacterium]